MSHKYYLHCITHSEDCEQSLNHGIDRLKMFWDKRYLLKDLSLTIEIKTYIDYENCFFDFVVEHSDCKMQIKSEYGDAPIKLIK